MPDVLTGESNEVLPLITVVDPCWQYDWDAVHVHTELAPEQKIQLACLKDAFETFSTYMGDRRERQAAMFRESMAWLFDTTESDWPFSLNNICEALGFSATAIRKRCRELERQHGKGRCIKKGYRRCAA